MHSPRSCAVVGLVLLFGCTQVRDSDAFDSSGATEGPGSTSSAEPTSTSSGDAAEATGAAGTTGAAESSESGGTEPVIYDVAAGDEAGAPTSGCQKIDFLFVVDNSASMGSHQAALRSSFGPFMDTIVETVQAQDYHVMVVDSDAGDDIATCEPCSPDSFWCGDWCDAKANLDVSCETTLGAGEVAPYNHEASNEICGVPGENRFLTSDASPAELKSLFECVANVGIFGSGAELPMSALVEAVSTQAGAGGCNEGFLRDDAILVVTVITDDYPVSGTPDNASTSGAPQAWRDALVQAKGGNADNIVMLGIVNTEDATCVAGAGDPIVHPTERFVDFVGSFGERGLTGNICESSYVGFFEDAVALIDTACDEFTPEG